jgi:hypothetical protein
MDDQDREDIVSEPQHLYDAYFNDRKAEVRAPSLYAAKLAAIALFKPRRSSAHMVSVVLKELADGRTIGLMESNADFG